MCPFKKVNPRPVCAHLWVSVPGIPNTSMYIIYTYRYKNKLMPLDDKVG